MSYQDDDGCTWVLINGIFLMVAGFITYLVFLHVGEKGYLYAIPGSIILVASVGIFYRRVSGKKSKRVVIIVLTWLITFVAIFWILYGVAEILPDANQAPTGGIAVLFYCFVSTVIGPVVVVGIMILTAIWRYLSNFADAEL